MLMLTMLHDKQRATVQTDTKNKQFHLTQHTKTHIVTEGANTTPRQKLNGAFAICSSHIRQGGHQNASPLVVRLLV